jgi:signal transduction histidine kinase
VALGNLARHRRNEGSTLLVSCIKRWWLRTLTGNAADAMSAVNRPRLLRLGTQACAPDSLLITVEDSGSGIDPIQAERIFEPFFTTKSHGMGMGLSICRSIVEHHGGHLSVVPGRVHGSIFQVSLPTAPPVTAAAAVTP